MFINRSDIPTALPESDALEKGTKESDSVAERIIFIMENKF